MAVVVLASPAARGAEQLTYRLKWLFNTSAVGDLYAVAHGDFADAGLDVTVKAGRTGAGCHQRARAGTGPVRRGVRRPGDPGHGQGIARGGHRAAFPGKSPAVDLRQSDPPIVQLADLRGRTIGITYGGNDETIMRTLLAKGGLTDRDVKLFSVRYDYTPFYQGKVDLWPVYRNTQGIVIGRKMAANGDPVQFFIPSDFGVKFVANSVVTSRQMAQERPDTVRRFIQALLKGWTAALDPNQSDMVLTMLQDLRQVTPRATSCKPSWMSPATCQAAIRRTHRHHRHRRLDADRRDHVQQKQIIKQVMWTRPDAGICFSGQ